MLARLAIITAVAFSQPKDAAFGELMTFHAREPFQAQAGILQGESFEAPFDDASRVSFDGFEVREQSLAARLSSRTDYLVSGERALGFTWNGRGDLQWSFDPPIYAFGVSILDFGTCCGATELLLDVDDGGQAIIAAVGSDLPRGNHQFFGFVSPEPVRTLRFYSDAISQNDLIVYDDLLFRPVPEPAGLGLGTVLIALTAMRRRGSRSLWRDGAR